MFGESTRENLKNMTIGLGLSVVVIGTALAAVFWSAG